MPWTIVQRLASIAIQLATLYSLFQHLWMVLGTCPGSHAMRQMALGVIVVLLIVMTAMQPA